MTRRKAREQIMCMLYESMFHDKKEREQILENQIEHMTHEPEGLIQFIRSLYFGIYEHLEEIDELIKVYATNWSFERISKIDLSILRLAIFEIKYTDVPQKVAVNEALEIAKRYSTDKAPKFINGILGSIIRQQEVIT